MIQYNLNEGLACYSDDLFGDENIVEYIEKEEEYEYGDE